MTKKTPSMGKQVEKLNEARVATRLGGGEARLQKQRDAGKLTARERVTALVDEGTFQEIGLFRRNRTTAYGMDAADMPADGVVTGTGAVFGRPIHVASQDFTVVGGSAGETHSLKVVQMMEAAMKCGTPFVFINDNVSQKTVAIRHKRTIPPERSTVRNVAIVPLNPD